MMEGYTDTFGNHADTIKGVYSYSPPHLLRMSALITLAFCTWFYFI